MSLLVVGLSHRSAPVSVLERASLAADTQAKLLQDTLAAEPATEAAVLATCNRIELYADVDKFHAGVAELSTLLAQHSGVGLEELTPYLYVHYEDRAVHHLFSVACGLDSMVVGEGQILGQIKDALALGQELHTAGRLLNDLFQQALRVGKRAHSETGIDRAGQSLVTFGLEQLAVGAGAEVAGWAEGKRALVIGAGSMSSLAAATLARAGVAEVVVANRTPERAERLASVLTEQNGAGVAARAVPMSAVADELTRVDVAISCTGATGLVLTAAAVRAALGLEPEPAPVHAPATADAGAGTAADDLQPASDALVARLAAAAAAQRGRIAEAKPPAGSGAPSGVTTGPAGQGPDGGLGDGGCPVGLDDVQPGSDSEALVAGLAERAALIADAPRAGADADSMELHGAWADRGATDRRTVSGTAVRRAGHGVPVRLALLDLAMPRDIDAAVHRIPGVRLVDIESLAEASADAPMAADVDQVRTIVADEVAAFGAAQRAAHITPTVVALRTMAADVVANEVARLEGRLPGLDDKERAEITQTVRRVVDKLLHAPTVRVKQLASEPGGAGYADALRELFDLDPLAVAAVSRADMNDVDLKNRGRAS
ncbi:glutamyl-tRNA reductase [Streptomyces sp. A3M-1-3]|uniref:glutamyl-tRNA reductase n=1 Tax=Streptomyces sp. A3M-1-3 TaxID=2962044 RepID=UPI0020B824C9|nr:glutamyl-tRNA reductase [Streptomyces sp. A3M-1-3]MCP3822125.1 glutamyl-tRNA reductase [Streptomyces sp. A3M-1-3]